MSFLTRIQGPEILLHFPFRFGHAAAFSLTRKEFRWSPLPREMAPPFVKGLLRSGVLELVFLEFG